MSSEELLDRIKENLNGRPGQPIVLGVCSTLAGKFEAEVWIVRAVAIVLGVFFTFATLAGYILLGLFMNETESRTKGVFRGLCIWAGEFCEKVATLFRDLFGQPRERNGAP